MIEEIERMVERACRAESNVFGYGIWTHHVTIVKENAKHLASRFDADPEIVEIAALLHDYASIKNEAFYEDHHVHGPREAEQVLSELEYPLDRIEQVKKCVAAHRASTDVARRSPEAICLASADAMAHIQEVPSLLYLAYVQHGMNIDEGATWVRGKSTTELGENRPKSPRGSQKRVRGCDGDAKSPHRREIDANAGYEAVRQMEQLRFASGSGGKR